MIEIVRYLSRADVAATAISPESAREMIDAAFRAHAIGHNRSTPKLAMQIGPGHLFQAMCAASRDSGLAVVKWLGMAPVETNSAMASIQATLCLNDYDSGALLAIMDGDLITLLRTAAMSAAAARYLAPREPRTIGFIGCGAQARYHLEAFQSLFPNLTRVLCYSRSAATATAFAALSTEKGLEGTVAMAPEALLGEADIVITTVPNAPGFVPFLNANWLKEDAFVASVDVGRSWMPDYMDAFSLIATDSLSQGDTVPTLDGTPLNRRFDTDLVTLAHQGKRRIDTAVGTTRRSMFHFRGYALGDLALATLVYQAANAKNLGTVLLR